MKIHMLHVLIHLLCVHLGVMKSAPLASLAITAKRSVRVVSTQ